MLSAIKLSVKITVISIRRRSDYVMRIITPAIGLNNSKKLTQQQRQSLNVKKLVMCEAMHAWCFSFKLCHGYCVSFLNVVYPKGLFWVHHYLFCIYVNDFITTTSFFDIIVYADDTTLLYYIRILLFLPKLT